MPGIGNLLKNYWKKSGYRTLPHVAMPYAQKVCRLLRYALTRIWIDGKKYGNLIKREITNLIIRKTFHIIHEN